MTTSEGSLPAGPPARPEALRLRLAGHAARTAAALSRVTGRGSGAVIGGRVLLGLAPGAARALAEGRDVTLVSGTNGKTTTAAMLRAAFGVLGPVDGNVEGANTPPGLVSTLARRHGGRVVLETDEGWIPWAVEQVAPSRVVLLNLSRDQLSRHHEVHRLAMTWRRALSAVEVAVANADDPSVVWPALAARRVVWVATGQRWTGDSLTCPACGDRVHRHRGTWGCVCGLRRPEPDWWLEGDDLVSASARVRLDVPVPGSFNQANAAMAVAAAADAGVPLVEALAGIGRVVDVAGRYATTDVDGHQVRLLLAKNPAGWLEMLDVVRDTPRALVLAFNSEGVDGRDPSWLYDVPFDRLGAQHVLVTGRRATDLQVRLELDGVAVTVVDDMRDALAALPPGPVDVVANYTAFQNARRQLKEMTGAARQ